MIKFNNKTTNPGNNIARVYLGNSLVWPTESPQKFSMKILVYDGSVNKPMTLPIEVNPNTTINWGDGAVTTGTNVHSYTTSTANIAEGYYLVEVTDQTILWKNMDFVDSIGPSAIIEIVNWGEDFRFTEPRAFQGEGRLNLTNTIGVPNITDSITLVDAFNNSSVTTINGAESWNLVGKTSEQLTGMFNNCVIFNQDLSNWCVETVPTQPTNFSNNTPAWITPKPNWGQPCL